MIFCFVKSLTKKPVQIEQQRLKIKTKDLNNRGISCRRVNKVMEGQPHIVDLIKNGQISLIINTTEGKRSKADSYSIRATAISKKVPYTTTVAGASAALMALTESSSTAIRALQELHQGIMR